MGASNVVDGIQGGGVVRFRVHASIMTRRAAEVNESEPPYRHQYSLGEASGRLRGEHEWNTICRVSARGRGDAPVGDQTDSDISWCTNQQGGNAMEQVKASIGNVVESSF